MVDAFGNIPPSSSGLIESEYDRETFSDAQVVIKIAQWRAKQIEHEIRVYTTAVWVEERVRNLILYLSCDECGIICLGNEETYQTYFENISHTLRPGGLRDKFRSRTLDSILYPQLLGLNSPSSNPE